MGLARWLGFDESPSDGAAVASPIPGASRAATPSAGVAVHTATDGRDILLNDPDGWEVDQPWLWWQGPAGGDGTGGPWGNPPPGADGVMGAAAIPAVTRCTAIICDTIAGMPWQVRNGYTLLPRPSWIDDPQALRRDGRVISKNVDDVRLSAVEFWTQWIVSALWFGDGYIYVPVRDSTGAPKPPLWQLHPDDVEIRGGRYWVRDVPFGEGEIIHLRGEPPYRKGRGSGVITRHGADLALAQTVREFASGSYGSGVPAGYLKVNAPNLTQAQATALKSKWMEQHGNSRRSIAVLNATTEFHPISLSPIDAQLNTAREWSMRDIALAFGVPPYMLGIPGDQSTYANVESRMIELRTFTLLPWIRRIESTLDAQLPRGTDLKINTDATLRADTATRYAAYAVALEHGWLTIDEIRASEDRAPQGAALETEAPDTAEPLTADTTPQDASVTQ